MNENEIMIAVLLIISIVLSFATYLLYKDKMELEETITKIKEESSHERYKVLEVLGQNIDQLQKFKKLMDEVERKLK